MKKRKTESTEEPIEKLLELQETIIDETGKWAEEADRFVRANPWQATLFAAALGLALGIYLRNRR